MEAYEVNNVHVQDITGLDAQGNTTITKRVTFYVGRNGPFVLNYSPTAYHADKVQADMQREVEILKAIGATPSRG